MANYRVSLRKGKRYIRPKLYHVWVAMKKRCQNPNHNSYQWYGGKGIKVCDLWQDYAPFREWSINHGYRKGLVIDRINSDGNYEPDNCRWVKPIQNQPRLCLSADDVRAIRESRKPVPEIARQYSVHATHIKRIRDGVARRDVR